MPISHHPINPPGLCPACGEQNEDVSIITGINPEPWIKFFYIHRRTQKACAAEWFEYIPFNTDPGLPAEDEELEYRFHTADETVVNDDAPDDRSDSDDICDFR